MRLSALPPQFVIAMLVAGSFWISVMVAFATLATR